MCNWAVFGLVGLGFLLEGDAQENYLIGLIGVFSIVSGFVGHIVINTFYKQNFTLGETALGLGVFAVTALIFLVSWVTSILSVLGFYIGLTLLTVLVVGFLAYVFARYGVRGAFDRFDVIPTSRAGRKK